MPGVPPNALSKLKGMLKGMLKPGKKNKNAQQQQQQSSNPTPSSHATRAAAIAASPATKAAVSSPPNVNKSLPPTQPAPIAKNDEAPLGSASATNTNGTQGLMAQEEKEGVSPVEPAARSDTMKSEPVSAVEQEDSERPPIPPKDSISREEPRQVAETAAVEPTSAHSTITAQRLDPALAQHSTEKLTPNGTTLPATQSSPTTVERLTVERPTVDTSTAPEQSDLSEFLDEKMPVMSEPPPPIKPLHSAPGMSATSGPLEDYPEGSQYH